MQHQPKPHQPNNVAFVLGNGTSRLFIDAKSLLPVGSVYGCNALYREMSPHALIAVDVKMVNEIINSGYHKTNEVWTNPNKGIINKSYLKLFNPHKGWSSGPTALWLAASRGHQHIYILGFDYQGLAGKLNNVYADTFNYKRSTDVATYHGNWLNQTERIVSEFKNTIFYRVVNDGAMIPTKLSAYPNITNISVSEFKERFPDCIYLDQNDQKSVI